MHVLCFPYFLKNHSTSHFYVGPLLISGHGAYYKIPIFLQHLFISPILNLSVPKYLYSPYGLLFMQNISFEIRGNCRKFIPNMLLNCRSQWPSGLRRDSAAARLLGLRVWIPPGAWMFVCCQYCVFVR